VLARGPVDAEAILHVAIDRAAIEPQRVGWPFLRDRRIDAYAGLTRRFDD
jgi:N-carbamoylputrescine amidase